MSFISAKHVEDNSNRCIVTPNMQRYCLRTTLRVTGRHFL